MSKIHHLQSDKGKSSHLLKVSIISRFFLYLFPSDGLDVSNNNNKEGNASIRTDKEESPMERKVNISEIVT